MKLIVILCVLLIIVINCHCQNSRRKSSNRRIKNKERKGKERFSGNYVRHDVSNTTSSSQRADERILQWKSHGGDNTRQHDGEHGNVPERCLQRRQCSFGGSKVQHDIVASINRNCFCDHLCLAYDDCCSDFEKPRGVILKIDHHLVSCQPLHINFTAPSSQNNNHRMNFHKLPIRMVSKCPRSFNDHFIRNKCLHGNHWFGRLPVNGKYSKILYKNYYCAVCNGDTEVLFWKVEKKFTANLQSLSGIGYIDRMSMDTSPEFYVFEYLEKVIPRVCEPNLISECTGWWEERSEHHLCVGHNRTSYIYALLRDRTYVYRNNHCATCNGIASDLFDECPDKEQEKVDSYTSDLFSVYQNPSFRILVDINTGEGLIKKKFKNGEQVTLKSIPLTNCDVGSVLDPFLWTCKQIFCRKNFRLTNSGCKPLNDTKSSKSTPPNHTKPHLADATLAIHSIPTRQTKQETNLITRQPFETKSPSAVHTNAYTESPNVDNIVNDLFKIKQSESPLNCSQQQFYNDSQIQFLDDGSIQVLETNMTYNVDHYHYRDSRIFVCQSEVSDVPEPGELQQNSNSSGNFSSKMTTVYVSINYFKLDSIQNFLSFVGIIISLSSMLITLACFIFFKSLRLNYIGVCVIGLTISLIFVEILLLLILLSENEPLIQDLCFYIALFLHFFLLSTFFWLNSLTYISFKNQLRHKSNNLFEMTFIDINCMLAYSLISPLIIVFVTCILDIFEIDGYHRPHYAEVGCWISSFNAVVVYFVIPSFLLTLFNQIFIIYAYINHCIGRLSDSSHEASTISDISLSFKLNLIIVLTWALSLASVFTPLSSLWFLFILFNCLTGPILFLCTVFVSKDVTLFKHAHTNGSAKTNALKNDDNMIILTTDSFISKDESSETSNGNYLGNRSSREGTLESRRFKGENESQDGFDHQFLNHANHRYQAHTLHHHPPSQADNRSLRSNQERSPGLEQLYSMRGRYTVDKRHLKEMVLIETCM